MAAVPVASGSVLMPAAVFIEVGDPLHHRLHHPHHQHHHPHGYAHRSSPVRFDSIFKAGNQYQGTRWELRELSRFCSSAARRRDHRCCSCSFPHQGHFCWSGGKIPVLGQLAVCNFCNFPRTKLNVFDTRTCWQQEELQVEFENILTYLRVCGHKGAPDLT